MAEAMVSETSMSSVPVLIVGAGPTGLVLALWLTRLGIKVRIIDRTAEPGTTSRALAVSARTLEYYDQIGLAPALVDHGVRVHATNFWVEGEQVAHIPLDRLGEGLTRFPYVLMYPQDAHERMLVSQLESRGVRVERRTELLRFEPRDYGVCATLKHPDGTEETCDAHYLAGCDGAHSTVRHVLGIEFLGGTYSDLFFVADAEGSGPAINGEVHIDLARAEFLAVFPITNHGRVRLVGTAFAGSTEARENLTYDDVRERVAGHLQLKIERVNWFSTYRVHHRVSSHFRSGRVFLLGDAAHVHSPVGGQGMNTGIGDAVNLAWKLAAVLSGSAEERLLDSYEPERLAFARKLVGSTDRVFAAATNRSALAWRFRTRVFPMIGRTVLRSGRARTFLFRTVSQIGVDYRASALSEGKAAGVWGGDRLPWVEFAPGEHNFATLHTLAWQVHVYGAIHNQSAIAAACARLGLAFHEFPWTPAAGHAGITQGALYLLRPDGYVALADAEGNPANLEPYFKRRGLRVG